MKTLIQTRLAELERMHAICILYACETGSRAWGFPSPDSDYDVRFLYVHCPAWYVSLHEPKDSLEQLQDDGLIDLSGWELRKALRLLWKSNAALLERLQSPIVYRTDAAFLAEMQALAGACYSPVATMHHYLNMAKKSFEEIDGHATCKLKRLFYALRAATACRWVLTHDTPPPIVFPEMLDRLTIAPALRQRIEELIALKAGQSEAYIHPAEPLLTDFIRTTLAEAETRANDLPAGKGNLEAMNEFLYHTIQTTWN
ncbi:hypothetical protein SAMN05421823_102276 [Catalinimonas alkaloidigena]|uniref:Nucleotidyltransferase n=1 Tax=Catalinimonas alkaloidigena TaxID=1075417 RepID=A0A1G9AH15_9BACT|nr:nucleotidyltransferase domain-containing protein [Catalinimonas alkaloidigena]SDK25840.1 hypothetical protein SAMN05421823_102276 [Catalinimonas alkaloidigena]